MVQAGTSETAIQRGAVMSIQGALQEVVWRFWLCPFHGAKHEFDSECSSKQCHYGLEAVTEAFQMGYRQAQAEAAQEKAEC
jgi:hypothetical protein